MLLLLLEKKEKHLTIEGGCRKRICRKALRNKDNGQKLLKTSGSFFVHEKNPEKFFKGKSKVK